MGATGRVLEGCSWKLPYLHTGFLLPSPHPLAWLSISKAGCFMPTIPPNEPAGSATAVMENTKLPRSGQEGSEGPQGWWGNSSAGHIAGGCAFPAGFVHLPGCLISLYHCHLLLFFFFPCPVYLQCPHPAMTPTHTPFPPSHLTPSTLLHPVTASGAASFCCRLAATPHQRGAGNIVAIGAVSPPNKTALMELLFDLLCFVFCDMFFF